jgi:hypothetical protein
MKQHCRDYHKIPVPEVCRYNICLDSNDIGLPYMLRKCIEGNTIYDPGGPNVLTPEQSKGLRQPIPST